MKADDYHGLAQYVRTQPDVAAQGVKSINIEMTFEERSQVVVSNPIVRNAVEPLQTLYLISASSAR